MKSGTALILCSIAALALAGSAWCQEPAHGELQRNLQMRQQRQDELRLRMQQYNRSLQSPPANAREGQATRQLEIDQRQQQQELHYRQNIEAPAAAASDDAGTRSAKGQIEQQRAKQQSEQQLQRFDWELQRQTGRRKGEMSN